MYWVMKNIMGHVLWERQEKEEGDIVPIQNWKENHEESIVMHHNINPIMKEMGISVPRPTYAPVGNLTFGPPGSSIGLSTMLWGL